MVDREASGGSRLRKGGRSRHRTGLDLEHLEVVVEGEDIPPPADRPLVGGDELRAVEQLDGLGTEEDGHLPPGESDRDRVAALANADPCLRVHPVLRAEPHIEGLSRAPAVRVARWRSARRRSPSARRRGGDRRPRHPHRRARSAPRGSRPGASGRGAVAGSVPPRLPRRPSRARPAHRGCRRTSRSRSARERHEPLALGAVPSRRTLVTAEVRLSYLKLGETSEGLGGPDVTVEEPPGTHAGRRGGSPSPTRLGRITNIFPTTRTPRR